MLNKTVILLIVFLLNSCKSRNLILQSTINEYALATQILEKSKDFYKKDSHFIKLYYEDFSNIDSDTTNYNLSWYYNSKDSIEIIYMFMSEQFVNLYNLGTNLGITINDLKSGLIKGLPPMSKLDHKCAFKKDSGWFQRNQIDKLPRGIHPKVSQIDLDTANFNFNILQQANGDSLLLVAKDSTYSEKYFFGLKGEILYYKKWFTGIIGGMVYENTQIFSNIISCDTVIDIEYFRNIDTCKRTTVQKKEEEPEPPELKEYFLGKAFPFDSLSDYINTDELFSDNKIIMLDYSFLSCFPCMMAMHYFDTFLSVFGDRVKLVMINPVDPITATGLVDKQLTKFKIKDKTEYYLAKNNRKKVTFNGIINAYPTIFFIDTNGIVRSVHSGIRKDETDYFKTLSDIVEEIINSP
jgi:thiol-disulfide isomerase/thioredoxin